VNMIMNLRASQSEGFLGQLSHYQVLHGVTRSDQTVIFFVSKCTIHSNTRGRRRRWWWWWNIWVQKRNKILHQ